MLGLHDLRHATLPQITVLHPVQVLAKKAGPIVEIPPEMESKFEVGVHSCELWLCFAARVAQSW